MPAPILPIRRARGSRRGMTLPEVLLWQRLRAARCGGLGFRRRHPVGPYILDFYCAPRRLAIEIDGAAHDNAERAAQDDRRDAWLAGRRIRVLRFAATDILDDRRREAVLDAIAVIATEGAAPSTASGGPPLPRSGGGSPQAE